MMGSEPGDEADPSPIDDPETAVLKERAAGVLAEYHQIELTAARQLLFMLAEYRGLSPNAMAAQVLDSEAARRTAVDDPPQSTTSLRNERSQDARTIPRFGRGFRLWRHPPLRGSRELDLNRPRLLGRDSHAERFSSPPGRGPPRSSGAIG